MWRRDGPIAIVDPQAGLAGRWQSAPCAGAVTARHALTIRLTLAGMKARGWGRILAVDTVASRLEMARIEPLVIALEDRFFVGRLRVRHADLHEESIELFKRSKAFLVPTLCTLYVVVAALQ